MGVGGHKGEGTPSARACVRLSICFDVSTSTKSSRELPYECLLRAGRQCFFLGMKYIMFIILLLGVFWWLRSLNSRRKRTPLRAQNRSIPQARPKETPRNTKIIIEGLVYQNTSLGVIPISTESRSPVPLSSSPPRERERKESRGGKGHRKTNTNELVLQGVRLCCVCRTRTVLYRNHFAGNQRTYIARVHSPQVNIKERAVIVLLLPNPNAWWIHAHPTDSSCVKQALPS